MGRHTVINPATGRRVLKTGAIGRAITKKKNAKKSEKGGVVKKAKKAKGGPKKEKFYGYVGATKRGSPFLKTTGKTKGSVCRPSARAAFDEGYRGMVKYADKWHIMAFRSNGSPYWKEI